METRTLDAGDLGRAFEIRNRSFGPMSDAARPGWEANVRTAIDDRRAIGTYDGTKLVGRAMFWPFRQWWGGRDLPMAGVAGVVVAPEYRGRGVGSALMKCMVGRGRELGYPLSTLYPATVPVYRSQGWEMAGVQQRLTIDSSVLRNLRGDTSRVREAGRDDVAAMVTLQRQLYARGHACGPKDQSEAEMNEELEDASLYCYRADAGFVVFGWEGPDLVVYEFIASDADTARALWTVVGSGSSVAKRVHAYLAPDDPVHLVLGESVAHDSQQQRWMLRCLDASAALAGRGYPAGAEIDVPVVLEDAQETGNRLSGRLQVSQGSGELVPGPAGHEAVRLSANGLAALYSGASTVALATAGLIGGDQEGHLAALDAAFAGRPPYLLEYF